MNAKKHFWGVCFGSREKEGGGGVVEFLCKWGHICVVSLVLMYANFPKTKGKPFLS